MTDMDEKKITSVLSVLSNVHPRKLNKVPFVELSDGKIQGVVSSGSDISRVYVSFIKADTHDYFCSTNNNRPCGGLRGGPCKHLVSLVDAAISQYSVQKVARFLSISIDEENDSVNIMHKIKGTQVKEPVAKVFSRFLHHLSYLELVSTQMPIPEMSWFVTPKAFD